MIILTKLNKEPVTINDRQIEFIEQIPESKVTMMNGRYYIVRESPQEIIEKVINFNREIISGLKVEV
ncbi:MAG: flagellar FlbD family protein [Dorea sp.]|nr:flagellar FlbD family protein [Dorea sp.]MCI9247720.1 flagellar FlbD family protein [Dorea sp.]